MMWAYILKLVILIPLVGGLAYGTSGKLAVVDFAGKRLLLGVSRTGISLLSETEAADAADA
jgi:flagellar biogenesis protein FliO